MFLSILYIYTKEENDFPYNEFLIFVTINRQNRQLQTNSETPADILKKDST